jgi:hypothetical protein
MSLKKKIVLSFLLSAFIIALLSAFLYLNFVEIKKETVFLELADTIRSRSLQLRRHEKNFLLYVSNQRAEAGQSRDPRGLEGIVGIPRIAHRWRAALQLSLYREHFGSIALFAEAQRIRSPQTDPPTRERPGRGQLLDQPLVSVLSPGVARTARGSPFHRSAARAQASRRCAEAARASSSRPRRSTRTPARASRNL